MTQLFKAGENHARKLFQALENKFLEKDLRRRRRGLIFGRNCGPVGNEKDLKSYYIPEIDKYEPKGRDGRV